MAEEITINPSMRMANGNVGANAEIPNYTVDQTTAKFMKSIQTVGFAAHEALSFGDVTSPGYVTIYNNDDENSVDVGKDNAGVFDPSFTIPPGESFGPAKIKSGQVIYLQASTADVDVVNTIFST